MFGLYDLFDDNEINIILLIILVIILIIIIVFLGFRDISLKSKLRKIEKEIDDVTKKLHLKNKDIEAIDDKELKAKMELKALKENYKDIVEDKKVNSRDVRYTPSEYATLLKYNPILPYSAFTMDIINNSYLDYNDRNMYDDRYFALSNYDNIYDPDSKIKKDQKTTSKAGSEPSTQLLSNNEEMLPKKDDPKDDF